MKSTLKVDFTIKIQIRLLYIFTIHNAMYTLYASAYLFFFMKSLASSIFMKY